MVANGYLRLSDPLTSNFTVLNMKLLSTSGQNYHDKDAKSLIKSQTIVVLTCDQNLTVQCIAVERRGGHLGYEM